MRCGPELHKALGVAQAKQRILVVDDDLDILESLQLLLEESYDVTVAENGAQALTRLLTDRFDAVVLDLMMPVMSGSALVHELARAGIEVPIVLASAVADLGAQASSLGVADSIAKPFDVDKLEQKLAHVIAASSGGSGGAAPKSSGPISPRGGGSGASTRGSRVRASSTFAFLSP